MPSSKYANTLVCYFCGRRRYISDMTETFIGRLLNKPYNERYACKDDDKSCLETINNMMEGNKDA
jgi:hypothetical protein